MRLINNQYCQKLKQALAASVKKMKNGFPWSCFWLALEEHNQQTATRCPQSKINKAGGGGAQEKARHFKKNIVYVPWVLWTPGR